MAWISVNKGLPDMAVRVWGWSATKGQVVVKLVENVAGRMFVDDNTMPVRDVIFWQYVVAPNETDAP